MAQLIQAKDLRGKRDTRLIDAVPLPAPWTVFIDPGDPCNYKCTFCPTGHPDLLKQYGRKPVFMSYELFRKIVDDMRGFGRKAKRVNLYKDGEPLLNKAFPAMVGYMKAAEGRLLLESITPAGRFGKPEEVAGALLYIINSTYLIGQTITVDGGWSVKNIA